MWKLVNALPSVSSLLGHAAIEGSHWLLFADSLISPVNSDGTPSAVAVGTCIQHELGVRVTQSVEDRSLTSLAHSFVTAFEAASKEQSVSLVIIAVGMDALLAGASPTDVAQHVTALHLSCWVRGLHTILCILPSPPTALLPHLPPFLPAAVNHLNASLLQVGRAAGNLTAICPLQDSFQASTRSLVCPASLHPLSVRVAPISPPPAIHSRTPSSLSPSPCRSGPSPCPSGILSTSAEGSPASSELRADSPIPLSSWHNTPTHPLPLRTTPVGAVDTPHYTLPPTSNLPLSPQDGRNAAAVPRDSADLLAPLSTNASPAPPAELPSTTTPPAPPTPPSSHLGHGSPSDAPTPAVFVGVPRVPTPPGGATAMTEVVGLGVSGGVMGGQVQAHTPPVLRGHPEVRTPPTFADVASRRASKSGSDVSGGGVPVVCVGGGVVESERTPVSAAGEPGAIRQVGAGRAGGDDGGGGKYATMDGVSAAVSLQIHSAGSVLSNAGADGGEGVAGGAGLGVGSETSPSCSARGGSLVSGGGGVAVGAGASECVGAGGDEGEGVTCSSNVVLSDVQPYRVGEDSARWRCTADGAVRVGLAVSAAIRCGQVERPSTQTADAIASLHRSGTVTVATAPRDLSQWSETGSHLGVSPPCSPTLSSAMASTSLLGEGRGSPVTSFASIGEHSQTYLSWGSGPNSPSVRKGAAAGGAVTACRSAAAAAVDVARASAAAAGAAARQAVARATLKALGLRSRPPADDGEATDSLSGLKSTAATDGSTAVGAAGGGDGGSTSAMIVCFEDVTTIASDMGGREPLSDVGPSDAAPKRGGVFRSLWQAVGRRSVSPAEPVQDLPHPRELILPLTSAVPYSEAISATAPPVHSVPSADFLRLPPRLAARCADVSNALILYISRRRNVFGKGARVSHPTEVAPGLFVSSRVAVGKTNVLRENGIVAIFNCAGQEVRPSQETLENFDYAATNAVDAADYDVLGWHLDALLRFVGRVRRDHADDASVSSGGAKSRYECDAPPRTRAAAARAREAGVLVHCVSGANRSAALAAGFLMVEEQYSAVEAIKAIHDARPVTFGNEAFVRQVVLLGAALGRIGSERELDYESPTA